MRVYWVKKYFPAFVFYTNWFVRYGGMTVGPFVFIKPKERPPMEAEGLLQHELTHARQFYSPSKWFWGTLKWEVEAYKVQLQYVPNDLEVFAYYLSTRYGLNITKDEAIALLQA